MSKSETIPTMRFRTLVFVFCLSLYGFSQSIQTENYLHILDIPYRTMDSLMIDSYMKERCFLDLYFPTQMSDFPTLIYFHGGSLIGGEKSMVNYFKSKKIAIVNVNYRLSPKVLVSEILDDAAASIAWVFNHIENYGGDRSKIYISGHSAGGYITSMVGLDENYLAKYNIDSNDIAGLIPLSGHVITHFTVRKEMGLSKNQIWVDKMAPIFHIKKQAPPYIMITGDRHLELLGRYEENAFMQRMMEIIGHPNTQLFELQGYGHNMVYPAAPLVIETIQFLESNPHSNENL